jgi:hypothetical protein
VENIDYGTFSGCDALISLTVEERNPILHSSGNCIIQTAQKKLIVGCNTSVIPDDGSVSIIASRAFYNCNLLTEITLPTSLTEIKNLVFQGCEKLKTINYRGSEQDWLWVKVDENSHIPTDAVFVYNYAE